MNALQLIILGTGNAMATRCYNTCFALQTGEEYFLVDAGGGNGIFTQCEKSGISFLKIRNMFVTHGHTDHVLGVIWVVRKIATLINQGKYEGLFTIYCHRELVEIITTICRYTLPAKLTRTFGERILFREVADGEQVQIQGMPFRFFDIGSTKMKQFGFRVELPNGKSLVCLGDEPYNERNRTYVSSCDWLLSEAFCLYEDRERFKPYEKHHSTALDAGRLAENLGVRHLVLYHTEDSNLAERKVRYSAEAASVFPGEVFVPDDLDLITL